MDGHTKTKQHRGEECMYMLKQEVNISVVEQQQRQIENYICKKELWITN